MASTKITNKYNQLLALIHKDRNNYIIINTLVKEAPNLGVDLETTGTLPTAIFASQLSQTCLAKTLLGKERG